MRLILFLTMLLSLAFAAPASAAIQIIEGTFAPTEQSNAFSWGKTWTSNGDAGRYWVTLEFDQAATVDAYYMGRTAIPLPSGASNDQSFYGSIFSGVASLVNLGPFDVGLSRWNGYGNTYYEAGTSVFARFGRNLWGQTINYRITITSNAQVPEPATWAMLIAGFGMAGSALRLRRRAMAANAGLA